MFFDGLPIKNTKMETIDSKYLDKFSEETQKLFYQRVPAILLVGLILIPMFTILDYVVVNDFFKLFGIYRLSCAAAFLFLMFLYYREFGKQHPFVISVLAYVIAGMTISLMVVKLGGYDSFYYAGILMVLVTFAAVLPLNARQSTISGILLYLIYAVPVVLFCESDDQNVRIFFNNSFFFVTFIVITVVQCYEETNGRVREFNLHMELDGLAERLSYYAHNLEAEVDRRVKELDESEVRYRELYDNIIDIVILVDRNYKILMANPRFFDIIGIPSESKIDFGLLNFVHPDDTRRVEEHMLSRLQREQDVQDFQFRLVNKSGQVFSVECNAKSIRKDDSLAGYQMVIRDITERRRLEDDLLESYKSVQDARVATILGLAKLAEYRDEDTGTHLERIREYAKMIAEELALKPKYRNYITPDYVEDIYNSSILHDIGKVGVPDSILLKPARLTPEEFDVVKRHSTLGGDALKAVEAQIEGKSFLTLGKEIAYYHHEKWDGGGYPKGLKGEEIPLSARIVALADVYDALTSQRVYKDAYSHEKATEIIVADSGTHFDPEVVECFLLHVDDFRRVREVLHENDELAQAGEVAG